MALEPDDDPGTGVEEDDGGASRGMRPLTPQRAKERADLLAELESGDLEAKPKGSTKKAAKSPSPSATPKPKATADAEESEDGEGAAVEDLDDDDAPEEGDDADLPVDSEDGEEAVEDDDEDDDEEEAEPAAARARAKALAAISAAEKRSKEKLRELRSTMERDHARFEREWEPKVALVQEFQSLVQRAKSDPISGLLEFAEKVCGLTESDFELPAKAFFERSPRGAADPKAREAGAAARRDAATKAATAKLQQELDEFKRQAADRDAAEESTRQVQAYLARAVEAVTPETPIVRRMLKKNPERTRARLHEIAHELAQENEGRAVKPATVVKELEKRRRAELEELGVDVSALVKSKKPASTAEAEKSKAGKKKPAKPNANGKAPIAGRALRDDVERALRENRLE